MHFLNPVLGKGQLHGAFLDSDVEIRLNTRGTRCILASGLEKRLTTSVSTKHKVRFLVRAVSAISGRQDSGGAYQPYQ